MIQITKKIEQEYDALNRPNFDLWFMTMAFLVSQRSLDPDTKHGTVVVDNSNTILAVGYNGPPRGCVDEVVPLTRPEKYMWMAHSEINAITNAARSGVALNDSIFYVTGPPCVTCFRSILNSGAKKLVYGTVGSACHTSEDEKVKNQMLNDRTSYGYTPREFQVVFFNNTQSIEFLLEKTKNYMIGKL